MLISFKINLLSSTPILLPAFNKDELLRIIFIWAKQMKKEKQTELGENAGTEAFYMKVSKKIINAMAMEDLYLTMVSIMKGSLGKISKMDMAN